ncbi:peptidase [Streptomyces sp. NPDC093223]|uniref:peptidase n=1 Tax=Streptomyces sp. NPDC093223 TaxID=3366033 RepID=UPI0038062174
MVTQYASPDLIERIAYQGYDPAADPAWAETGAPSRAAYARWCRHICGIACLRMILLHQSESGHAPYLFTLLRGARRFGAYGQNADGTIKGLIYAPFTEYVRQTHGLPATVHGELDLDGLTALLDSGHMVLASVSKEIRRPDLDPERAGGHLVLVTGLRDGQIHFRNPSGHTPHTRAAVLPLDRFGAFFGGRGVSVGPRRTVRRRPAQTPVSRPVASPTTT